MDGGGGGAAAAVAAATASTVGRNEGQSVAARLGHMQTARAEVVARAGCGRGSLTARGLVAARDSSGEIGLGQAKVGRLRSGPVVSPSFLERLVSWFAVVGGLVIICA